MRDSPRLPPHLLVVCLLGALSLGVFIFVFANLYTTILQSFTPYSWHLLMTAVNLLILALTCYTIVRLYRIRLRMSQPEGGPFPLGGWKSQVAVIVLWTAFPLCALTLAIFIPANSDGFGIVFPATMLAGAALLIARFLARLTSGEVRTPEAG